MLMSFDRLLTKLRNKTAWLMLDTTCAAYLYLHNVPQMETGRVDRRRLPVGSGGRR